MSESQLTDWQQRLLDYLADYKGDFKFALPPNRSSYVGFDMASCFGDHTTITLMEMKTELRDHNPRFIIIDEIQPLLGEQVQKIIDTYGHNKKLKDFVDCEFTMATLLDETPMIKKNGQMVRRHHPVPSTPRRFRK
jgi:hypothetical protein